MIVTTRVLPKAQSLSLNPLQNACQRPVFVCKRTVESGVQMLHANEKSVLLDTEEMQLCLQNHGANNFSVECDIKENGKLTRAWRACISPEVVHMTHRTSAEPGYNASNLIFFVQKQLIPMYATCRRVSANMQGAVGRVLAEHLEQRGVAGYKRIDNTFTENNAVLVNKLTDMLNLSSIGDKREGYSFQYCNRLIWLAACFCATVPESKAFSLFNVSQLQMSAMSGYMAERVYEQLPEKQHITTLLRGADATDRIARFNLAVRFFAQDSEVARELMPRVTSATPQAGSPVLIVTGIHNNKAAAIYLSCLTQRPAAHQKAVNAFFRSPVE
jgi:hypothetical protein